jgi:hypothetical protein
LVADEAEPGAVDADFEVSRGGGGSDGARWADLVAAVPVEVEAVVATEALEVGGAEAGGAELMAGVAVRGVVGVFPDGAVRQAGGHVHQVALQAGEALVFAGAVAVAAGWVARQAASDIPSEEIHVSSIGAAQKTSPFVQVIEQRVIEITSCTVRRRATSLTVQRTRLTHKRTIIWIRPIQTRLITYHPSRQPQIQPRWTPHTTRRAITRLTHTRTTQTTPCRLIPVHPLPTPIRTLRARQIKPILAARALPRWRARPTSRGTGYAPPDDIRCVGVRTGGEAGTGEIYVAWEASEAGEA